MSRIEQLNDELKVKRATLGAFTNEIKGKETAADAEKARQLHAEINDIGAKLKDSKDLAQIEAEQKAWENAPASPFNFGSGKPAESKTLTIGEQFTASPEYKTIGKKGSYQVELKTTLTTSAGYAPQVTRNGIVVPYANRQPVVADLITQGFTSQTSIAYMAQTTFTNNAAERAENAALAESAFLWAPQTSPVASIGTFVPVTEEQLDDVPGMQSLINDQLALSVILREDYELLNGNGSGANITGLLNASSIQTQARGSDSNEVAVLKAITACRATGFAEPDGVVIHPLNWLTIRTATASGSGVYLTAPITDAGGNYLWGLPVVLSTAIAQNTALVGAFRQYAHISRRQSVTIDVGFQNDDFVKVKRTVRAVERMSLECLRPAAFCKVTSMN